MLYINAFGGVYLTSKSLQFFKNIVMALICVFLKRLSLVFVLKAHSSGLKVWIHYTKCYIFSENHGVGFMWCKSQISGVRWTNLGLRAQRVCVCVSPAVKHRLCAFTCSETTAEVACVCANKTRLLFIPVTSHPCTVLLPALDSPLFMPVLWLLCAPPSLAHKEGLIT